jgi:HlyD family secretion protein
MATSNRARVWKLLTAIIAVAVILGGGAYFWTHRAARAPVYSTVTVDRGDVIQAVTATGDIEPVLSVNVSSQISGIISKLYVDWNSPVKQGQLMAQLDPATFQANVLQAEGQLANAQASFQLTRVNTDRTRDLFAKGLVTQADVDQAGAQLLQAEAQVKIQTASLETTKVNLARCTLYSPIDGVVISRQVDVGNTVAVSLNAPTLFVIANDLAKMQIIAAVAEADIGTVAVGQTANFTVDAFPNQPFHGRVNQIRNSPQTQQNVVVYQTIIGVDNPDLKLRPGMTANVSIIIAERSSALRIANSALRARIPDQLVPKPAPATAPAPAGSAATPASQPLTDEGRRRAAFAIMTEVGFTRGGGPPSAEIIQKAQQLAKNRGLDLDFSQFTGGRQQTGGSGTTIRTLYKLVGPDPKTAALEAVKVKLGITDGIYTEIVAGLVEGDVVVTAVTVPGMTAANGARPAANPFAGSSGAIRR